MIDKMSNSELLNINIVIADRPYPLKVKPEEEETVRRAAKALNDKVKELSGQYAAKDKQDYLAMCALMNEVENLNNKEKITISDTSFIDKLDQLDSMLSEQVKAS